LPFGRHPKKEVLIVRPKVGTRDARLYEEIDYPDTAENLFNHHANFDVREKRTMSSMWLSV
jgi:hypothetical protein